MSKIAVLGSAPSSASMAPFHEPDWEIWACSPPNIMAPRVDAWFELHNLDRKFIKGNEKYQQGLMAHPRVYIGKPDDRLPNGIVFNWQALVFKYGPDFFTSSVAWMLAFAIEQQPEKIGLWGVDMAATSEYSQQRPGCKFFMREARNRGIEIYTPGTSDIDIPNPLYAIQEHWRSWQKSQARMKELKDNYDKADRAVEAASMDRAAIKGAIDDLRYHQNTWLHPEWIQQKAIENVTLDPRPADADTNGPQPTGEPRKRSPRKKRS